MSTPPPSFWNCLPAKLALDEVPLDGYSSVPAGLSATLALVQALGDAGFMIFSILSTSLTQKLLPEDKIARANGFGQVMSGVAMTASILGAGAIAEVLGVKATKAWAAGLGTLGLLPLLTPALWTVRDEPEETAPETVLPEAP